MFITKSRTAVITLAASASLALAGVAPAVSQAQWHTICKGGHCTTHSNYNLKGSHPCTGQDYVSPPPSGSTKSWTDPVTPEDKAAASEQDQMSQFEGVCQDA